MNIFGKILVWVVVVMAAADLALSARLLQIRNSWSEVVEKLDAQNKTNEENLEVKRRELADAELQATRAVAGWDTFWDGIHAQKDANSDTLNVDLGTDHGVGVQRPLINAFRTNADGTSVWVGEFRVETSKLNPGSCNLVPIWNLREGEAAKWTNDSQWRFRSSIPVDYPSSLISLYSDLELIDDDISSDTKKLVGKKEQHEAAKRDRDYYNAILLGNANTGSKGLIDNLKLTEKDRNSVLEKVDRLRREVKKLNDRIKDVQDKNLKLAKSLEK